MSVYKYYKVEDNKLILFNKKEHEHEHITLYEKARDGTLIINPKFSDLLMLLGKTFTENSKLFTDEYFRFKHNNCDYQIKIYSVTESSIREPSRQFKTIAKDIKQSMSDNIHTKQTFLLEGRTADNQYLDMYTERPTSTNNYGYSYWSEFQDGEVFLNDVFANSAIKENGRAIQPIGDNVKNVSVETDLRFTNLTLNSDLIVFLKMYQYVSPGTLSQLGSTVRHVISRNSVLNSSQIHFKDQFQFAEIEYKGVPLAFKVETLATEETIPGIPGNAPRLASQVKSHNDKHSLKTFQSQLPGYVQFKIKISYDALQ
jgi:hypothetical protein